MMPTKTKKPKLPVGKKFDKRFLEGIKSLRKMMLENDPHRFDDEERTEK